MSRAKTKLEHWAEGTQSQAKAPTASAFVGGRPRAPKHLSPLAQQEFKRVVRLLEKRRTITPGDADALAVYAEVFARWVIAKTEMGDRLIVLTTITDNHGEAHQVEKVNPLLKIVQQCEARLTSIARFLAMTPTDREKAKVTKNSDSEVVVPGSLAETHPELFVAKKPIPINEEEQEDGD